MLDSLKVAADSVADTVNWTRECYFMLVDIRGDLNLIFLLILGMFSYGVIKLFTDYYEKRKKKKERAS
jgi:hypothetical protein